MIVSLSAAALALASLAQLDPVEGACSLVQGPAIRVNIEGLKDRTGRLKVEIYPPNAEDFLRDDTSLKAENKPFRRVWTPTPAAGPVSVCIRTPTPGHWALLVTHDRDGKNKFNFWRDGAGFAGSGRLGRRRPRVGQAMINVPAGGGQITVKMQYLKGLGGFGPL